MAESFFFSATVFSVNDPGAHKSQVAAIQLSRQLEKR